MKLNYIKPKEGIMDEEQADKLGKFVGRVLLVGVAIVLVVWLWPLRTVQPGHMGVATWFGYVQEDPKPSGLRLVWPLSKMNEVDIRVMKHESKGEAASKDLQTVHTTVIMNFNVIPSAAQKLYLTVGMDYEDKLFDGALQETFKAITANYTAENLIKQREQVTSEIGELFRRKIKELSGDTIKVDAVQVKNFQFSPAFNKSIEDKQIEDQRAQQATNILNRVRVEADQKRTKAQGEADAQVAMAKATAEATLLQAKAEAESLKLKSQAITETTLRMSAIEKWNGTLPLYMSGSGPVPFVSVPSGK